MKPAGLNDLRPGDAVWSTFQVDAGGEQPLQLDIFLARGAQLSPLALFTAGVHGDEYEGPDAVAALSRVLPHEDLHGSVIAIPVVNPMAFAAAQRLTPVDGKNLARCFPGRPDGSPTERLAHAVFEAFVQPATHLVDLHSGGVEYRFAPVAGYYGPASGGNPSYLSARRFGLDHLWRLPETAGVLSCEASKAGKVSIGCEYLGAGQLSEQGSAAYVRGMLSCLAQWDIRRGHDPLPESGKAWENDWQLAETDGIFHAGLDIGSAVREGDVVAFTTDPRGNLLQKFVAKTAGVVLALRSKAWVRKGDWGVLVGAACPGEDYD